MCCLLTLVYTGHFKAPITHGKMWITCTVRNIPWGSKNQPRACSPGRLLSNTLIHITYGHIKLKHERWGWLTPGHSWKKNIVVCPYHRKRFSNKIGWNVFATICIWSFLGADQRFVLFIKWTKRKTVSTRLKHYYVVIKHPKNDLMSEMPFQRLYFASVQVFFFWFREDFCKRVQKSLWGNEQWYPCWLLISW
jgi:hypothetical protein